MLDRIKEIKRVSKCACDKAKDLLPKTRWQLQVGGRLGLLKVMSNTKKLTVTFMFADTRYVKGLSATRTLTYVKADKPNMPNKILKYLVPLTIKLGDDAVEQVYRDQSHVWHT